MGELIAVLSGMQKAQKAKSLERSLEVAIPDEVYARLSKEMGAGTNG